jgi:hypothetical protein
MLHGFQKKTPKTPLGEIETAEKRMFAFVDPQENPSPPTNGKRKQSKKGKGKRK